MQDVCWVRAYIFKAVDLGGGYIWTHFELQFWGRIRTGAYIWGRTKVHGISNVIYFQMFLSSRKEVIEIISKVLLEDHFISAYAHICISF